MHPSPGPDDVVASLCALADLAHDAADTANTANTSGTAGTAAAGDALTVVVAAAARLAGADHASITELAMTGARTLAASHPVAAGLDAEQYRHDDGPCLDAARTGAVVSADLAVDRRWPRWRHRTLQETPVRHVHSHPIRLAPPARRDGSLNLYSADLPAEGAGQVAAAVELCRAAVAVLALEGTVAHLHVALRSARDIGAATGVLMARHRITQTAAFDLLRERSQRVNRKLRDVADEVLLRGELG